MANNKVGENALERTVRQLALMNMRLADMDVDGMERFTFTVDGQGKGTVQGTTNGEMLYRFGSLDQLESFLSAPLAKQVLMMVRNA